MTWAVSIDESGNLGKDSRFFVMDATVVMRRRNLLTVSKTVPRHRDESKFYNSTDEEIVAVLSELSRSNVRIVYVSVDKYDHTGPYYGFHGNRLYEDVLRDLLQDVFDMIGQGDVVVFIDRSSFIDLKSLRSIAEEISTSRGCNLKRCDKVTSHQNRCVQIADYVAGAINRYYENDDGHYLTTIKEKVSVARKN